MGKGGGGGRTARRLGWSSYSMRFQLWNDIIIIIYEIRTCFKRTLFRSDSPIDRQVVMVAREGGVVRSTVGGSNERVNRKGYSESSKVCCNGNEQEYNDIIINTVY